MTTIAAAGAGIALLSVLIPAPPGAADPDGADPASLNTAEPSACTGSRRRGRAAGAEEPGGGVAAPPNPALVAFFLRAREMAEASRRLKDERAGGEPRVKDSELRNEGRR